MGLKRPDGKRTPSLMGKIAAARKALEPQEGRQAPLRPARIAIWRWDLATGTVEWDERLEALFGYKERVTNAAWRESRIHPDDRARVTKSLQRATIANHGAEWSDRYRFRRSDGSYATVTDRAYVVQDEAGPREVLGAVALTSTKRQGRATRPLLRTAG
jgi:PAS domain S-box-containing protein